MTMTNDEETQREWERHKREMLRYKRQKAKIVQMLIKIDILNYKLKAQNARAIKTFQNSHKRFARVLKKRGFTKAEWWGSERCGLINGEFYD